MFLPAAVERIRSPYVGQARKKSSLHDQARDPLPSQPMETSEQTNDVQASEDDTAKAALRAKRIANLRPYRPGQSGNPSGLAKDGLGSKDHPIRATLRAKLAKRRALHRLVDTWIDAACDGDSAAREQILKRLDPVTTDESTGRQVVFEGLRLELPDGTRAEVLRSHVEALQGPQVDVPSVASEASTPDVTLSIRSDAVHELSESRAGGVEQPVSDVSVSTSPSESPVSTESPDSVDRVDTRPPAVPS